MKDKVRKGVRIVPHSRPTIGKEEAAAAASVVKSGHIAQGRAVKEFELGMARFVGVKGALAVSSGTAALHLGLLAMGIGKGDDVILPSFVCTAPLNAVYYVGARPRLCDIELESFNISLDSISDNVTKDTKAIIVPHMFGSPADIEKIEELGIPIIEDCAHAIGALYGKKKAGSLGRFAILSFYANKMLACGEGGMLLSDDTALLDAALDLRDYDEKEDYKVRFNYKMTDIQAAVGFAQLKKLPAMIRARKKIARVYDRAFSGVKAALPRGEFDHVYYRYVVRTEEDAQKVFAPLRKAGIMCSRPVYKPLHRYLGLRAGFKDTDRAYSTALSVPIYPSLSAGEQKRVIKVFREHLG